MDEIKLKEAITILQKKIKDYKHQILLDTSTPKLLNITIADAKLIIELYNFYNMYKPK